MSGVPQLTLLSRAYCSLCDEMERAAARIAAGAGVHLEVIDIDARPDLLPQWDVLVPVLFLGSPAAEHELCHYTLDAALVREAITRHAGGPVAAPTQIG